MNETTNELRTMADELKADAKALWFAPVGERNRDEAMTLIRLFHKIVNELHRREVFASWPRHILN